MDSLGVAVHGEQDAPAAHAGLADTGALGERGRETRVERVMRELADACSDPPLRGPVETVEQFLRFVGDSDAIRSQAAFALVIRQRLHPAGRDIGEAAIK